MKKLLFLFAILVSSFTYAQDTTQTKNDSLHIFTTEVSLSARNLWRGIEFGGAPSIQTLFAYGINNFEVGVFGTLSANGFKGGYANTLESYVMYSTKGVSVSLSDYFFFNVSDTLNDYFNYGNNTEHLIEARLRYDHDKFWVLGGYCLYSGDWGGTYTTAPYIEAGYMYKNFTAFIGGVTGPSTLNFMDKAGISNIGVTMSNELRIGELTTGLVFNPNFENITPVPGVGRNPVNLIATITF